jgi:hypothetical protein
MRNTLNWFELFVADLPRAQRFYEQVLATTFKETEDFDGTQMAIFSDDGLKGALVKSPRRKPAAEGALVYLNCNGALDACLSRVEKSGGKVVLPKTDIGAPGHIALMVDSEGNTVGLHSVR